MIPCVDNQVLEGLNSKAVPLKPEAPWIKKCSFGIKFTDEIYMTDDDRENTPDEDKEYKKRKQRQQERAMEGHIMVRSISEPVALRNNIFVEQAKPENEGELDEEEIEKINREEAEELRRMAKQHQNAYMGEHDIPDGGLNANRDTEESGEKSQEDQYEEDFERRYREKSKAYERMDEINKLK